MYGSITVPGGLGLPSGEVDQETQERLAALLKGLTAEMDITGSARKLAQAVTIALEGAVAGSVGFDGSKGVTIRTVNNQLPVVGNITLTAAGWISDGAMYRQPVNLPGLTARHQVDLYADYATEAGLTAAILPVNDNGSFYALTGQPPEADIPVQYTMTLTAEATVSESEVPEPEPGQEETAEEGEDV